MNEDKTKERLEDLVEQIDLQSLQIPTIIQNISSVKQVKNLYKKNIELVEMLLLKKEVNDKLFNDLEEIGKVLKSNYHISLTDLGLIIEAFKKALVTAIQNRIINLDEVEVIARIERAEKAIVKGFFYALMIETIEHIHQLNFLYSDIFEVHYDWLLEVKKYFLNKKESIYLVDMSACGFTKWLTSLEAEILMFAAEKERYLFNSQIIIAHKNLHLEANYIVDFLIKEDYFRAVESLKNFFNNYLLLEKLISDLLVLYEKNSYNIFIEFMLERSYWEKNLVCYFVINLHIPKLVTLLKNNLIEKISVEMKKYLKKEGLDFYIFIQDELHLLIRKPKNLTYEYLDKMIKNCIDKILDKYALLALKEEIMIYSIRLDDLKNREINYFKEILIALKKRKSSENFIIVGDNLLENLNKEVDENLKKLSIIKNTIKNFKIELFAQKNSK